MNTQQCGNGPILLWLPLVLAIAACAQPVPDTRASAGAEHTYPDPLDLAAAHVEAIGGRARVEAIRGYHSRSTFESPEHGAMATVEEWIRPGDGWRENWHFTRSGLVELGFDGRLAWTRQPELPPRAMRDELIREAFASRAVLHPETDIAAHLGSPRTVGQREIGGRSTWEVQVTTPAGAVQSRFYEQDTGLLRGVQGELMLTGQLLPMLMVFEDWRAVDGILVPHRVVRGDGNAAQLVSTLDSVSMDALPPEAVRPSAEIFTAALVDIYAVEVERDAMLPMRDGVRLATDIYRPVGAGERLPVILIRLPYDKSRYSGATRPAEFFAERGYVVVVQDARGKWASEGEFVISQSDRHDGYDTIEWAASQPWSNGRVGTYGCSYLGENQVMLAAERHPAHVAMIPDAAGGAVGTAGGRYGFFAFIEGGALALSMGVEWFPNAGTKDRTDAQAAVPLPEGLRHLPTVDILRHYGVGPTDWEEYLTRPLDDPWWQSLGYVDDSDTFATPALHVNSWYDYGAAETLQLFNLMRRNGVDERTRENQYVIISPMTHCRSANATENTRVGDLDVGDARFPFWEVYLRWFDHWVKGIDNDVTSMPRVQYYVTGANEWRSADEWPVPEARPTRLYLRSGGEAGARMDDGVLSAEPPAASEPTDLYVYDPADPVPSRGGGFYMHGAPEDQPGAYDQSELEQRDDVLVYTTAPLDEPLDVVGPLRATLYVSSSAPDTDFTVKLVDVHPDGRAFNVQDGIVRARYREGFDWTVWMRPGEVYEVEVDLHATAHRFLAGHRVRIEVSSSNFPRFDRNLNTGGDNVTETEWRIAENAIHHSVEHPSHLVLPVVAGEREASASGGDTVEVAPPTGVRERDRPSILAALEQVGPGGTIQFAPGTYIVGEIIRIAIPRITLLGHAGGTVLRGCDPDEQEEVERRAVQALESRDQDTYQTMRHRCGLLELTGGKVTVRGLTFEHARTGLALGCCEGAEVSGDGDYLVESNTFRNSANGIRASLISMEPTVIRGNRFVNVFHALSGGVSRVHMLDNDVSVPEPDRVPGTGHPGFAIGIRPPPPPPADGPGMGPPACEQNVIAGNRIEGHTDGILLRAFEPGTSCRDNMIRDNVIEVRRVRFPVPWLYAGLLPLTNEVDTTFVGVPLGLINAADHAGAPDEDAGRGGVENNSIEENRIVGAHGVGIQVLHASRNRIANNTITRIRRRDPYPGNITTGSQEWAEANGSGIWISPGSDENEIRLNVLEDVASHAVFLEGDSNRVELQSADDTVRDLGRANRVDVATTPAPAAADSAEVRARIDDFLAALSDDSPTFVAPFYAQDAVLVLPGGVVLEGREAIVRGFLHTRVPPLRGVRALSEELVGGGDTVTWEGAIAVRVAPAPDTIRGALSATWARQSDGEWYIAHSTVDLPDRDGEAESGPVRSGFFQSAGARLHYLDFGGAGVPLVFMPNRDRTAYTFIDFAPRFTDRNRVLAVTSRGTGESGGEWDGAPDIVALGRDVIALLDSLGLERAVVAHAWAEVLVYLAEQHPGRVAGLVFLGGMPQPSLPALWDADTTGILEMVPRLAASWDGAEPDEAMRLLRERWYPARYLRVDQAIEIPALVFLNESQASSVEDRWQVDLEYAQWVASGELAVPDSATRAYFLRLASDEAAQAESRAVYRDLVAPAHRAAEQRFRRAFGEYLRMIPLEERAIGYGYREAPEVIEPQIRRFLDEVGEREGDPPTHLLAQSEYVPLAITNVTVIDVSAGVAEAGRTVVVEGDRITAVGAADEVAVPAGAAVVDATGKFLIPGLWDMHAHSWEESIQRDNFLPLYVAYGVTGVREMSGEPYELEARAEVSAGTLLGPRMVVSSPIVDGPNPISPGTHRPRVVDAAEARRTVDALHARGYDLIQTHQFLSPAAYRAIHERAREIGIEVSGTIPMSVSLWEAAALGHRTVEHLWGVELACSSREEELRVDYRRQVEEISADTSLRTHVAVWTRTELEPLRSIDPTKCQALYRHLAANQTWVVPTLLIQRLMAYASDAALQNDPRQRYLPGPGWAVEEYADFYDPERRLRATYEHRLRTLVDLQRAGVGILAGSEVQAGFSLHDELALYVESGLTPLEALRTATLNPARYLNATDSLGTVEAGKLADLVLLDANPLEDISNTQRISAVVLNGRHLDRRELDALLAQAEAAAGAHRESSDASQVQPSEVDLSPGTWQASYDAFEAQLPVVPTQSPVVTGQRGAVAVGYFGLAAQAGLEALQRGGTAVDAALTTALTQIALDGGKAISYFGVMALVYYDAETGVVHTMNADWNSVLGENDPLAIPGGPPMVDGRLNEIEPSGRTALVGGFMKGVDAAHERFGRLPFAQLFEPAIYVAREGVPVTGDLARAMELRATDLARLPETAATFLKPDGHTYQEGEVFRQPALAQTLAAVASKGSDYMYEGAWAERLIAAVQADGGSMTMEDLARYDVIWDEPLSAPLGDYVLHTMPPPMLGGVLMIEAQNLAVASGLTEEPHWSESAASLRQALTIAQATMMLDFMSEESFAELYPGLERTDSARITPDWAEALWARLEGGTLPMEWREQGRTHSDVIVVADAHGNVAALGHSINAVHWGKTAIVVDGVTISDAGSFLRGILAEAGTGARVPGPSQVGILTRDGEAVLGFASKGGGMHHRPFQGLLSFVHHGMPVGEAAAAPDFFVPTRDPGTGGLVMRVPEGRFPQRVLDGTGWAYQEIPLPEARASGEGVWVAVSRNPETGQVQAASHTRSNSAAVAHE